MAETDILNPPNWSPPLSFNPNPSYGFGRKVTANRQLQRPRLGPFASRDVMNGGHIFSLSWMGTSGEIVQRVNQFYHSFKDGYFTYIDHDLDGRHFVGRFTTEPEAVETGNGKYSIQSVVFEEVPTARMLVYPSNFVNDGHTINVVDDFLSPRIAGMVGTWAPQVSPLYNPATSANTPAFYLYVNAAAAPGDWAQAAYVGWGFQMTFVLTPSFGFCDIALDGTTLVTALNLATGFASAVNPLVALRVVQGYNFNIGTQQGSLGGGVVGPPVIGVPEPSTVTVTVVNVPLDMHRVRVTANASTPAGLSMIYPPLTYIY